MARVLHPFRAPERQRLRLGEVELEVSARCNPREQIAALRPGLQAAMQGRRGMLCRVLTGGTLQRGELIELKENNLTAENLGNHRLIS